MQSSVEPLEGNKVKLSISVDEADFNSEIDAAFRRIAREVEIPGFRPGKAPRRILEARIGTGPARSDALEHAVPEYYSEAVTEHEVDPIAQPEIDITAGEEEGDVSFDAVVEVRPRVNVAGYDSLRVTIQRPEATEDDIGARLDQLRQADAEMASVNRPAFDGDHVSIDITGSQNGEALSGLTAEDYLYEVGSEAVVPEMDDQLRGSKAGDILAFSADHPDPEEDPVDFRILVKDVREQRLPELTDEWAAENSDFDTAEELRADVANRLTVMKRAQASMAAQEETADALAGLVEDDPPEALINTEMQQRIQDMAMRLQAQGMDLEQYLEASGTDQETFVAQLRDTAARSARIDLALRAVADAEEITCTGEDIDAEIERVAEQAEEKPARVRENLESSNRMADVIADVRKRKALEWVMDRVEMVDPDGAPISRDALNLDEGVDDDETDTTADESAEATDDAATDDAATDDAATDDAATDDAEPTTQTEGATS